MPLNLLSNSVNLYMPVSCDTLLPLEGGMLVFN
jgi:hypothetical protein